MEHKLGRAARVCQTGRFAGNRASGRERGGMQPCGRWGVGGVRTPAHPRSAQELGFLRALTAVRGSELGEQKTLGIAGVGK